MKSLHFIKDMKREIKFDYVPVALKSEHLTDW